MLYKLALCAPTCKQSISVMAAFENGEPGNDEETGALDLAWQLNAGTEFGYYNFSKEVIARSHAALLESENPGNVFWATDKGYELADTSDSTVSLLEKAESCGTDFTAELAPTVPPTPASSSCWPRPQPPRPRPCRLWQNSWPHKVCSLQFAPAALYCG